MLNTPVNQGKKTEGTKEQSYFSSPPAISLPKGGGAIKGMGEKFGASPVTGTGAMSVPIVTTPGRSGFGPQLSLTYDSGAGNSIFGMGWNLSLPSITRKTEKGLPRYWDAEESDVFILSGAEDLVPVLKADETIAQTPRDGYLVQQYRPRIEGLFARIECWKKIDSGEIHWRSISKDNITTLYGKTKESRIADSDHQTHVFSWLICESYDDKGNAIQYKYKSEDSEGISLAQAHEHNRTPESRSSNRYLKRIYYGNRVSRLVQPNLSEQDWLFEAVFDYGEHDLTRPQPIESRKWQVRNDPFSTYRSGFEVRTYRLCHRVLMFHHIPDSTDDTKGYDGPVRSTDFEYASEKKLIYSFLKSVTQTGYKQPNAIPKSLPPLEFTYSEPIIDDRVWDADPESLENLPEGLDGTRYQWVDLDGEGLSGILTEQGNGWFYKRNLSPINPTLAASGRVEAKFAAVGVLATKPASGLANGAQFMDLAGDGQTDVAILRGGTPGFYERTSDEGWETFIPFKSLPNVDWDDPNLKFIDLDGDGRSDILIMEGDCFKWHSSLAEDGFGTEKRVSQPLDEEKGARVIFADSTQSIYLADMSGDGLTDIVRIRNGEVCYWPNLGYGKFGVKVAMDDSPWFDRPDIFNQRRIILADIDGSGTTDILYLSAEGVQIYFNQSGNSWTKERILPSFPAIANTASVTVLDLLGNGTACLVWSSPLPGDARQAMRYIDLMGGQKPHLLIKTNNNLGAKTTVKYAPSTKFYLQDQLAGKPWITKLPFPVHCVEKVTVTDKWRQTSFSTSYTYHHGYFDGVEREFRGFGRVEQVDVESFGKFAQGNTTSPYITGDFNLYQPPIKTITWHHLGIAADRDHILASYEQEYFPHWFEALQPEQANVLGDFQENILPEPDLDRASLSAEEWREAMRACKGMMLRQEVYELDVEALTQGKEVPVKLFTTAYHNCHIQRLQTREQNRYAVFLVTESEAITYNYELDLRSPQLQPDPRIAHTLNLQMDELGNVLQSVAVVYPRLGSYQDTELDSQDLKRISDVQTEWHLAYTETRYTNDLDDLSEPDLYRLRVPCEVLTYELTGISPTSASDRQTPDRRDNLYFSLDELKRLRLSQVYQTTGELVELLDYHQQPSPPDPQKRLVEHVRMLYFKDDLSGSLAFGQLGRLGLPYETYKLALTEELLTNVFGDKLKTEEKAKLTNADISGYFNGDDLTTLFPDIDTTGQYWIRSGIAGFAGDAADHFYLPERYTDPFGNRTMLEYDRRDLYIQSSRDELGNTTEVTEFDFRVLAPSRIKDVNGNFSEVWFDVLGFPVAKAILGKGTEADNLDGFDDAIANPNLADLTAFFTGQDYNETTARNWLKNATMRYIYHFGEVKNPDGSIQWGVHPACACGIMRERHVATGGVSPIQTGFEYSDGMGTVLVKKVQAEPTLGSGVLRWIANGKTILNNKGKAVKQYEPYFSEAGHRFDKPQEVGVTPIMYYDAAGRLIRTESPDGSYSRVEFSPWEVTQFDPVDTVAEPDNVWLVRNSASTATQAQQQAARLAVDLANTPAVTILDSLGREVVAIAHNRTYGVDEKYVTFTKLDAEGKPLWIRDARGSLVMQYVLPYAPDNRSEPSTFTPSYDIAGNLLFQHSMDAGDRWMLMDAMGKPILAWDVGDRQDENNQLVSENRLYFTAYDQLHRPIEQWLTIDDQSPVMVERYEYQDGLTSDPNNLNGQLIRHFDPSGLVKTVRRDFKGNVLEVKRRLNNTPEAAQIDWQGGTPEAKLETKIFTQMDEFDALNRMTRHYNWHLGMGSRVAVYEPVYNQRGLLVSEKLTVRAEKTQNGFDRQTDTKETDAITEIRYNAKGQKEFLRLGNGTLTQYEYDPLTFRLQQIRTTRPTDSRVLQQLLYTYDPVGNIAEIYDDAYEPVFFQNQQVEPRSLYTYDALYRLIATQGREQAGTNTAPTQDVNQPWAEVSFPVTNQTLQIYTQRYTYDAVGNIKQMEHQGVWKRDYAYAVDNSSQPASNRLLQTWEADNRQQATNYSYDVHGNMLNLANSPDDYRLRWDYRDMIARVNLGGGGLVNYQYDAGKQRTRKHIKRNGGVVEERIYLGGYELYRRRNARNETVEEIESLHLFEGEQRVLLVDDVIKSDRTQANGTPVKTVPIFRYQYSNHLGSACLELDEGAEIISYEEFHPYGTSAYRSVKSGVEVPPKRYRYTGMERDEESGLSYHTARYYLPWLARWGSADPIGINSTFNLYGYGKSNPSRFTDRNGKDPKPRRTFTQQEFSPEVITVKKHTQKTHDDASTLVCITPPMDIKAAAERNGQSLRSIYQSTQSSNPNYFKSIKDSPEHVQSLAEDGTIRPNGIKTPIEGSNTEAQMTVRHLQGPDTIVEHGTERTSWTKNAGGAVERAGGDRRYVVKIDPLEVEAYGSQFKETEVLFAEAKQVEANAKNSAARSEAKYAARNATKYSEGHVVGKTPSGTVKPIGLMEGRDALAFKAGKVAGYTSAVGASVLVSGLSNTSATIGENGRVQYQFVPFDSHIGDGAQAELDYFLGVGPKPDNLDFDKNKDNYSGATMLGFAALFFMFLGG